MSVRTLAKSVGIGRFATGTYTGDGAATQGIVGVGFQPRYVTIYPHGTQGGLSHKTDRDGVNSKVWRHGVQWYYDADHIISLNADGFTVGDGTPLGINMVNVLNVVYTYVAFG